MRLVQTGWFAIEFTVCLNAVYTVQCQSLGAAWLQGPLPPMWVFCHTCCTVQPLQPLLGSWSCTQCVSLNYKARNIAHLIYSII